jgi:hypothetical protein
MNVHGEALALFLFSKKGRRVWKRRNGPRGESEEANTRFCSTHPSVHVDGYSFFCAYQSLALLVVTLDASKQS